MLCEQENNVLEVLDLASNAIGDGDVGASALGHALAVGPRFDCVLHVCLVYTTLVRGLHFLFMCAFARAEFDEQKFRHDA